MRESEDFQTVQDIIMPALFNDHQRNYHVPENVGDYVDAEGYLCCGQCHQRKEYRRFETGSELGFVMPCLCECGKRKRDLEEAEQRDREKRIQCEQLIRYGTSDEQFYQNRFENCVIDAQNAKAVATARKYAQNFEQLEKKSVGLLFYGSFGTGKTFLANCIANDLMDHGIPVFVTSIIKLAAAPDLPEILSVMKNARLLIIDDFGAERGTDFMMEKVFQIFDDWLGQKKPLIVTTNLVDFNDETNMRLRRIYDRISSICKPVLMNGASRRRQIGAERFKDVQDLL